MSEWKIYSLDDLCGNIDGAIVDGPFGSNLKTSDYVEVGIPVLQGQNLTNDKFNLDGLRFISKDKAKLLFRSNAQIGDIISVKIGSVGFSAIIDKLGNHPFAIIPANLLRIRIDKSYANNSFVYYLLTSENGKKKIIDLVSSTAQPAISLTKFKSLRFLCPELNEQRRIAQILSTCDTVIEKTQAAIAKYKAIKQGMLHDLFTRGVVSEKVKVKSEKGEWIVKETWKLRLRYEDAPELYKESKLGWIPREWECEMLSSIIEIISGGTPSTQIKEYWDGEIPWLSVDDFNTGNRYASKAAKKITEEGLKDSATNMLLPGMLIISARGTVGVIAQMKAPMAFNQSCYGLNTVNEYLSNDYLYYYLTFFIRFIGFKSYGSVFDVITRSSFDEVFIPINKKSDEQRMIVEKLTAIDTKLQSEQSYLEKMQQIKKGLMEDLLSGKKKVKVERM